MSRRHEYLPSDDLLAMQEQLLPHRAERVRHVAEHRMRGMMVVMEDVHNPHNLAAIARSCDAFGVQDIAFTVENHELFDPQEVGRVSSSSASKWLDYRLFEQGTAEALKTLHAEGWHVLATVADPDAPTLYDLDYTQYDRLAVMVGNEHAGLSPAAIKGADTRMTIPMFGMIQSFNVSVATAITLAEITRQRRADPDRFLVDNDRLASLHADLISRALGFDEKRRLQALRANKTADTVEETDDES